MARKLCLVVAALLLLAGGWLVWDSFCEAGLEKPPGGGDRSTPPSGGPVGADPGPGDRSVANPDASREELDAARSRPTEEVPAGQAVHVRVVQDQKKRPAPGATVRYLPMDWADKLDDKQRARVTEGFRGTPALLRRCGYLAQVDDQGVATVRNPPKGVVVHGRLGELTGQLWIPPNAPEPLGGWLLELKKEWSLRVQVVDGDDKPVPGIPIAFTGTYESHHRPGAQPVVLPLGKTRQPRGILMKEEVGHLVARWAQQGPLFDTACGIYLPGLCETKVPCDAARPPTEILRLVLPETGSLRVEIVDAVGKPVAGTSSVAIQVAGGKLGHRESSKSGGRFHFPWVGLGKSYQLTATVRPLTQQKLVAGPTAANQEVSVRIALPATGKILVRISDSKGRPLSVAQHRIDLVKHKADHTFAQLRCGDDGTATFEQVPLGAVWDLTAFGFGPQLQKQVRGPMRAGETVPVDLRMPDNLAILVGRALDVDRKPLAGRHISFRYRSEGGGGGSSGTETNSKGRFYHVVNESFVGKRLRRLQLLLFDPQHGLSGEAAEPARPAALPKGITNLGDVIFKKPPLAVSGTLAGYVPSGRRPSLEVEGLDVYVRRGAQRQVWRSERTVHLTLQKTGDFEFRGRPEHGRLRLKVSARGYLPIEPIEFTFGTRGLRVPMTRGGSVVASVKVDRGIQANTLHAQLVATSGQADTKNPWHDPCVGRLDYQRPKATGELSFRWIGLQPGVYRLELGPQGVQPAPVMVANIEVVAGRETRDERLEGLDLRGKLQQITLTIQTPDGKPLKRPPQNSLVLVRPPGKLTNLEGQTIRRGGQVRLTCAGAPLRALVIVAGYPVKDVDGILKDTTIRLDRPLPVVVRVRGGPVLSKKGRLLLTLTSTRKLDRATARLRFRTPDRGGGLDYCLNPRVPSVTVKDGKAVFQVLKPGEYRVHGTTTGVPGARRRVLDVTPKTIQIRDKTTEQSFEVEIVSR